MKSRRVNKPARYARNALFISRNNYHPVVRSGIHSGIDRILSWPKGQIVGPVSSAALSVSMLHWVPVSVCLCVSLSALSMVTSVFYFGWRLWYHFMYVFVYWRSHIIVRLSLYELVLFLVVNNSSAWSNCFAFSGLPDFYRIISTVMISWLQWMNIQASPNQTLWW